MIDVKQMTRLNEYDEPILDNVSFHINKGDFAVIFGQEAECRMRLLHCIMGYEMYFSGSIRYGNDVQVVRYVPADVFYDGNMTAEQYLIQNSKRFDTFNDELCGKMCDKLGVDVSEVMGNMTYEDNKIVQLVAAICCTPDILMIDEAEQFVGIEKMNRLLNLLKKLNQSGVTIIYSCNNYETVKGYCNRYIMLHEGKVIADGEVPLDDVRKRVITIEGMRSETLIRILGEYIATKNGRSSYVYEGAIARIPYIFSKLRCRDYLVEEMTLAEELTNDYSRWNTL